MYSFVTGPSETEVTNPNSNHSTGSATPSGSTIASPTSQLESAADDESKKLYAQSLESTENSIINSQEDRSKLSLDLLHYPVESEHEISTDEGLSMSEEDEMLTPQHSELTKLLSDLDIDLKLKSAAQKGETELVKELLCNGAQVVTDESGSTAIHVAAQNGFAEVVRLLLESGTDVDLPDSNGYTALHKAAGQGHLDVSELLINEGCDIDTQDDVYGNTPLHEAAWHGYSKSVDLLLKNKSNAFITNRAGCTALHLAAQNGHNQSGRTLLYGGCSPDVKNNYGDTPLHTAARYGHAGIARILISARCSVAEQNKNGDTALHITAAFKRRKIAKLLVDAGISSLIRNKQDETAVDIAKRKDHPDIIEIIFQTVKQPVHSNCRHVDEKHYQQPEVGAVEPQRASMEKEEKKKSHNTFVSWIRKKFSKKTNSRKDKSSSERLPVDGEEVLYSNQYVKKPGFAYYRDLAGNIRQGPCGFVPACHCDNTGSAPMLEETPAPRKDLNYATIRESQLSLSNRMAELKRANRQRTKQDTLTNEKQPLPNKTDRNQRDINKQLAQVENDLQELRGDLKTWLTTQADSNCDDNPFAYAIGHSQMRFGDDFDHERMARYDVTEEFPPPPRLFRSRSDETLSHSEYSYHGRAFKSKEAAMEELKTLKHHEELRARRRRIRAAGDDVSRQLAERRPESKPAVADERAQLTRRHSSKPNLWQSRENIRQKEASVERHLGDNYMSVNHLAGKQDMADVGGQRLPNSRSMPLNTAQNQSTIYKPQSSALDESTNQIYSRKPPIPAQRSNSLQRMSHSNSNPRQQPMIKPRHLIAESSPPQTTKNHYNNQNDKVGSRQPLPSYAEIQINRNLPARHPTNHVQPPRPQVRPSQKSTEPPVAQTGESCCGSSNPDSGYGGQNYDFYASQLSPQQTPASNQASKDYDSWYSKRLQDAARRINTYSALRPQRTMTSDV